ncbi:MAG: tetratricopeptide repeat protein [Gemmatimonadetes bacterium]|nr:tetratricopeptide repeat protein [Gemmatimonadota bacterium]
MKIRFGLVLSLALGIGAAGCAAGGASSGGGGASPAGLAGGTTLAPGERPRQDQDTRNAQRLLDQAGKMEDKDAAKQFYQQALDAAHAAIAADSTNPLPRLQAGEAAIGVGDYLEANKQLTMAEQLRPLYQLQTASIREKAWIALYSQAAPLVNQGKYQEAVPIFEQANEIYRERPEVMIVLGQIYGQLHEHDKALANLDSALLIINDSTKTESMDSATVADWKQQAETIPITRAQVLADAGRYDEAITAFRDLAREHPNEISIKRNLASLLVQTGKNDEAVQVYTELLTHPELTSQDLYQIGVGFYQMSDYKDAVKGFSGAANKTPKDRDALEMWARSLQIDSVYDQVPPVAERWIAVDPNNQNAYLIMAQAVNQMGDGQKAQELVNQIEALPVTVDNVNITRSPVGGAQVNGVMTNKKLAEGAQVTITFTFYDDSGIPVGTASQSVTLGAKDQPTNFSVDFQSSSTVGGYGYQVQTP